MLISNHTVILQIFSMILNMSNIIIYNLFITKIVYLLSSNKISFGKKIRTLKFDIHDIMNNTAIKSHCNTKNR